MALTDFERYVEEDVLTFVILHGTTEIINPRTRMVIIGGQEKLKRCGFELIGRSDYDPDGPKDNKASNSYKFKSILYFKYRGRKACKLINSIEWPTHVAKCLHFCETSL